MILIGMYNASEIDQIKGPKMKKINNERRGFLIKQIPIRMINGITNDNFSCINTNNPQIMEAIIMKTALSFFNILKVSIDVLYINYIKFKFLDETFFTYRFINF
ncbi:hypothetical protein ADN00_09305 [Ornatilinea apprima]|uniref:Uncharacterized protein n=1 Tax=Ornatilinea apprima TaxID=1134406 RepID=A0A0N8GN75_9CHLR|nr:hypothetical protein ADN00_09305 [Ornatilinea apprima]